MMLKFRTTFVTALLLLVPVGLFAQGGRGGGAAPAAAQGPRAAAPVDLTGYWVSIVTEDWIERMSPDSPPSGTGGARGLGNRGPETAPAGADPCRVYAAGGSLRVPGRLHITWADDTTLKVEMDAGTQTRLFHFNPTTPAPAEKSLQGHSVATWELANGRGRGGFGAPAPAANAPRPWGSLNGYLLSSRSAYSDNATLTEYFSKHSDFGTDYMTVTAMLQDGARTIVTSSTFKKEADGAKFKPAGCDVVR
jgi:hypothetical protein